ncbi:MAG TPA: hypothetical protein VFD70_18635 [Anaerolineae bacterium]|nr:hypothetical protein [Anaerolineae bacterium]
MQTLKVRNEETARTFGFAPQDTDVETEVKRIVKAQGWSEHEARAYVQCAIEAGAFTVVEIVGKAAERAHIEALREE